MAQAKSKTPRPNHLKRVIFVLALVPVIIVGLWIAIHRVPWLGPLLADTARSVVGTGPIARLEDIAYGLEDRWNLLWRGNEMPEPYWDTPEAIPIATALVPAEVQLPPVRQDNVPPMHKSWSAPGDGAWVRVEDKVHPGEPIAMFKTLLHPDRTRSWTAVTVVAIDLRQLRLRCVAGRYEPKASGLCETLTFLHADFLRGSSDQVFMHLRQISRHHQATVRHGVCDQSKCLAEAVRGIENHTWFGSS